MPGYDRTGPLGTGPVTGAGRGRCIASGRGIDDESIERFGPGRRMGRGRPFANRRHRGFERSFAQAMTSTNDLECLKFEARYLERKLQIVNASIHEIQQQAKAQPG